MVIVIDAQSAERHNAVLRDMHRERRKVFVDALKWRLPLTADGLEIDQFDTDQATYLVCVDPETGDHLSSVRLLPSLAGHVLGDIFDGLCDGGAPRAADVWEISRFCTSPSLTRERAKWARRRVTVAMLEYALLNDIRMFSCVISLSWLPTFLAPGWRCEPLGGPQNHEGDMIGAFGIHVTPAVLQLYRLNYDVPEPVLTLANRRAA